MASEHPQDSEQTKPVEEKIADLHLQDKGDDVRVAAKDYVDTAKDAIKISSADAKEAVGDCKEAIGASLNETVKEGEKPSKEPVPDERAAAEEEVAKSTDKGAYAVPTVEHRTVAGPDGKEKKEDVQTAVVHENADAAEKEHENADVAVKEQQQGKGIVGKISSSVKSIFTGITGSKTGKTPDDAQK